MRGGLGKKLLRSPLTIAHGRPLRCRDPRSGLSPSIACGRCLWERKNLGDPLRVPHFLLGERRRNRTFNLRIKSPLLCLIELAALRICRCTLQKFLARPAGFEPATCGFEVRRSIQLSYGRPARAVKARIQPPSLSLLWPFFRGLG